MAGPPQIDKSARSTVLVIGKGETMDAALRVALDRHGLNVVEASTDPRAAVTTTAPDLVLLVGDAAKDGGRAILDKLGGGSGTAASVPVAVLGALGKLDTRLQAFRHGAVAVVPRTASVDAIATRVAALVKDVQERAGQPAEELGEATFDELVDLVSRELRSGILSVQGKDGEAMRIVLGAGRPVAAAVEEFVRRLRPLVSRAEPLTYEIHAPTGGAVGLLDAEPGTETDPSLLEGLRVLLVDTDPARADAIAQELRARKVVVAVADASGRGLERARGLDPEVVILDAAGIEGPGFEVVRAIRRDVRLRWASMLVAPWDDIWPTPESTPDVGRLAERIAPLVENDRSLRARVATEQAFDARLESTGPCRFLRILATAPSPVHAVFRSRAATVEVDVAEGLVVGAQGSGGPGETFESVRAISALLAMGAARVHVERRANPTVANLMAPVEEALARAAEEVAPIPVAAPPPKSESSPSQTARRRPFPTASELRGPGVSVLSDEDSGSHAGPLPHGIVSHAQPPRADAKDLRWSDTDEPGADLPPREALAATAFRTAVPGTVSRPALAAKAPAAAFGAPSHGNDTHETHGVPVPKPGAAAPRAPAVRKATLAMGGPLPAGVRTAAPTPTPAVRAPVASPESRNRTVTMGSVPPSDLPPPSSGAAPPGDPPPTSQAAGRAPEARLPAAPAPAHPAPATAPPPVLGGRPRPQPKKTLLGVAATLSSATGQGAPASASASATGHGAPASASASATGHGAPAAWPPPMTPSPAPGPDALSAAALADGTASVDGGLAALLEGDGVGHEPLGDLGSLPPLHPAGDALDELAPPAVEPREGSPVGVPREDAARAEAAPPPTGFAPPPQAAPPSAPAAPVPPSAAATAAAPVLAPARRGGGARTLGWALLGLALVALAAVGGVVAWTRLAGGSIEQLLALAGLGPPGGAVAPVGAPDAGTELAAGAPSAPDAGAPELVVAAALDTGAALAALDAGVGAPSAPDAGAPEAPDAGVAAVAVAPPATEGEAGVEPPPAAGSTDELGAEALVARAETLPPPQAEVLYRRALELDPRYHHAMIGLAELLVETGRPAEAIPFIERAIARRRTRGSYRVLLGDARRAAGDAAGATAAWREALEVEPGNAQARARLGL